MLGGLLLKVGDFAGSTTRRDKYGKQIVVSVARQLTVEYGRSFEEKNLRRMMQFAQVFNDEQIVVSLIRQLSPFARRRLANPPPYRGLAVRRPPSIRRSNEDGRASNFHDSVFVRVSALRSEGGAQGSYQG